MTNEHERVAEEIVSTLGLSGRVCNCGRHHCDGADEHAGELIAAALAAEGARADEAGWRLGREQAIEDVRAAGAHWWVADRDYTPPEEQP